MDEFFRIGILIGAIGLLVFYLWYVRHIFTRPWSPFAPTQSPTLNQAREEAKEYATKNRALFKHRMTELSFITILFACAFFGIYFLYKLTL